ncbi:hypothetical protein SAMN05421850_1332 [Lutimaribacter saemankumensis]|uniref:Uncharacterized protein n=2 Tax=Lutimaribacter saemankumensis TaxID=490829 RepID=A0A1G8TT95_9RHOB|nr:hypothetical protein SAMN05421850_1332 [Lutimaribacter saemankumensis]
MPFRIADYREAGIFRDEEQRTLAEKHGLSAEHVNELSLLVGNALDVGSYVTFVRISRSRVQRDLERAFNRERLRADPLLDDIGVLNQVFAALSLPYFVPMPEDSSDAVHMAGPPEAIWGTGTRDLAISGPHIPVTLNVARKVLVPDNRRNEYDSRRRFVVQQCCYVALDAGWQLSFTTDARLTRDQRTGPLVELIKDVLRLVTDPPQLISGETIIGDIKIARTSIARNGDYPALK